MKNTVETKVAGGKLVRVTLEYDSEVRKATITGDFFLHPEEGIETLEQSLIGVAVNEPTTMILTKLKTAVEENELELVGFSEQDLAQLVKEALI